MERLVGVDLALVGVLDVGVRRRLLVVAAVGVLAAAADGGAVLPEGKRDGAAGEAEEGQEAGRPLVAHAVVHLLGEEHDAGAPEGADARLGRERRGRLVLVRVDQVVVGRVVEEDEAKADGQAGEAGADPGQALVGRPGENEEADGDEPAAGHHGDEADLGGRPAVVLGHEGEVVLVDERGADGREDDADGDGDEHEARDAGAVALADLKDDGVGDEEHVQEAVQDRHVQADEEDDELGEEQLEGADQEDADALGEGPGVELGLGDVAVVAGLLPQLRGAASEDRRGVGLGDGEGDQDPDNKGEDELDPVEPAPASRVGEETANEGADCRRSVGEIGRLAVRETYSQGR